MTKAIRQQNAERRLRHCRWERERKADIGAIAFGALTALVFIAIVIW